MYSERLMHLMTSRMLTPPPLSPSPHLSFLLHPLTTHPHIPSPPIPPPSHHHSFLTHPLIEGPSRCGELASEVAANGLVIDVVNWFVK